MVIQIIGSSHIAEESKSHIYKKILAEKPDIVALELDFLRYQSIFHPVRKFRIVDILKLGLTGWLFAVIGLWLQKKFGERVNMVPGADMRAAIKAAKQVKARIALIDKPIQLTLCSLSKEIQFFAKLKFFAYFLFGGLFQSEKIEFDLRKVPDEKIVKKLTNELKQKFPTFYKILVTERNMFMANQIMLLEKENPHKNIVVVLGAGHVMGVKNLLKRRGVQFVIA